MVESGRSSKKDPLLCDICHANIYTKKTCTTLRSYITYLSIKLEPSDCQTDGLNFMESKSHSSDHAHALLEYLELNSK